MMTSGDIQNKKFEKGMGGYKTEEVHLFLSQVADQVSRLERENSELLEKMEILAEKLEQYREDEESLRAALIGAQKLGQSVVKESQEKAEAIIAQAVKKAEGIVSDAQQNIDREALALSRMQRDVASFREKIIEMYTSHLEMIKNFPVEEDISNIKVAQINYAPPTMEDMNLEFAAVEENQAAEAAQSEPQPEEQFVFAGASGDAKAKEAVFPKRKKNFKELDQFFGEDKPVERQ